MLDDTPFRVWLRQRLLIRVLPEGERCCCGENATNIHVLTCGRLSGNPRIFRHNGIMESLETSALGFAAATVRSEPVSGGANRSRPDLIITTMSGKYATDVTVATPGTLATAGLGAGAAASAASRVKRDAWQPWAQAYGMNFCPFVVEATGTLHTEIFPWLRRIFRDRSICPADTCRVVADRAVAAMLKNQVALFVAASGNISAVSG
jgi:hypothetical protein